MAQTLLALERLGQIRLSHSSDAARSLLLGERRVSDLALVGRTLPATTVYNGAHAHPER